MPAHNLLSRVPRHLAKTVTFDGTTWGDIATADTIATCTGRVLLLHLSAYCSTTLVGASATIELGVAGNTAGLIAQTTAANLIATEFWNDATPTDVLTAAAIVDKLVASNIILTTATAAVTAGVIEFSMLWLPMSVNGNLA